MLARCSEARHQRSRRQSGGKFGKSAKRSFSMASETRALSGQLDGELAGLLERNREVLVRRWLTLVVERSSLEELAAAPLSRRVEDLDLLLEAAGAAGAVRSEPRGDGLRGELDHQLDAHRRSGQPFSVAILAAPTGAAGADAAAWSSALRDAAGEGATVADAGGGATALLLPGRAGPGARHAVDRVRVAAWDVLGGEGGLVDAGIATCPDDGSSPHELLAAAHARLGRSPQPEEPADGEPPPGRLARLIEAQSREAIAAVTPLRP